MKGFLAVGRLSNPLGAQMALSACWPCAHANGSGQGAGVMHSSPDLGTWWHPEKGGLSRYLRKELTLGTQPCF